MNKQQFLNYFQGKFNYEGAWREEVRVEDSWTILTGVDEHAFGFIVDCDNEPAIVVLPQAQKNGIGLWLLEQYMLKKASENIFSVAYTTENNESLKLLKKFANKHKDVYTVFKKKTDNHYAIICNNDISALMFAQLLNLKKM